MIKATKSELKEMVQEAVRSMLNEAFDRGDHAWAQDAEQSDVLNTLKQAKMPPITRNKMDQVIAALEAKADLRRGLALPVNKNKIEKAIAAGQFEKLANALEAVVVRSSKMS